MKTSTSIPAIILIFASCVSADLLSISDEDSYAAMRTCVQGCYFNGNRRDQIGSLLDCPQPTSRVADNACFCRADLQAQATSYLEDCIATRCPVPNDVDVTSGVALYTDYCTSNGFEVADAIVTTTTEAPSSTPDGDRATITVFTSGETQATNTIETTSTNGAGKIIAGLVVYTVTAFTMFLQVFY